MGIKDSMHITHNESFKQRLLKYNIGMVLVAHPRSMVLSPWSLFRASTFYQETTTSASISSFEFLCKRREISKFIFLKSTIIPHTSPSRMKVYQPDFYTWCTSPQFCIHSAANRNVKKSLYGKQLLLHVFKVSKKNRFSKSTFPTLST